MGLRIICIFVILFIGTNAQTVQYGDDNYKHLLEMIIDLQSTVIHLESTVTNLRLTEIKLQGVVSKQTTELEHMEEKVEKLEKLESTVTNLESTETNLESTVTNLESTVTNLEGVVSKQTTYIEYMEEKVENLEEKQLEMEAMYPLPTSCKSISQLGYEHGVYTIAVNNSPLQVYCQDGWTVIQKRYDGSLDYNRTFDQYAHGFGSAAAEHWIGLNHMHELTSTGNWTIRFDLIAFNGETAWAEYDDFRIDPGTDFTLWFDQSSYRGTAGKSFDYHHAHKFTTTDVEQDYSSSDPSCAEGYGGEWWCYNCAASVGGGGGWWYGWCSHSQTTGMPYGGGRAIYWWHWKENEEALKAATMKIIPN